MKALLLGLVLTTGAFAQDVSVKCETKDVKLIITESAKGEISISFGKELALADGIMSKDELDLIAKFPLSGEMTLVAKIGKTGTEDNYLFFMGKRNPVICK